MYYDAIDLLKGMISRPSFSREEGETADFLKQSWEKAGYKVNRKGNNLWLIAPAAQLPYRHCQTGFGLDERSVQSGGDGRRASVRPWQQ